jgi:hypothetical protein
LALATAGGYVPGFRYGVADAVGAQGAETGADMAGVSTARRQVAVLVGILALVGAGTVVPSTPAGATSVNDETSFRDAWANAAETQIDLEANIALNCADPLLGNGVAIRNSDTPLTLDGHGHTILQNCITGPNNGVLQQDGSGALTFNNVTVTGGNTSGVGGGLQTDTADVTLNNSTFADNRATDDGGGIHESSGNVTVTNSTISGNFAFDGGGIRESSGSVTVTNSTISGNTALNDGGGIRESSGSVTVTNSTISGNTSDNDGGGIRESSGNVAVTNSTISGNAAGTDSGGGIRESTGDVTLVYATVVQNTDSTGANIRGLSGSLISFGSVVALPQGGGTNCTGVTATSNGFNFSDDASCGFTAGTDKQNAGDPSLGALADNGGPTRTRLPLTGSPLIDAIPTGSCQTDGASGITADQRGVGRPQGPGCDIGAVEVEVPGPTPTPGPGPAVPVQAVVRFTG